MRDWLGAEAGLLVSLSERRTDDSRCGIRFKVLKEGIDARYS